MSLAFLRPVPAHESFRSVAGTSLRVALYIGLSAVTLSPLLWVRVPPLVDYPSHLARLWILVHRAEIPELARNYIVHWRLLPDLAMDLIVPFLSTIMTVEQAGRVFIALMMGTLIGGTAMLHRAIHGSVGIWPIWSVLFVYNAELFWGFPTLFATGVYLFAFGGWIATGHWRAGFRIMVFSAVATILCLLHLFAFGLYALSVVAYEFGSRPDMRAMSARSFAAWASLCLQFMPGLLIWYATLLPGRLSVTEYGDLAFTKSYALFSPFAFGFLPVAPFDRLLAPLFISFFGVAIITRSLKLASEMRLPIAAMIVVSALMPHVISGSWFVDIRLPVMLPFVIIASTRFEPLPTRVVLPIAIVALIVLGVRVWTVSQTWRDYDHLFAEFRSASAVISPGTRLLVVQTRTPPEKPQLPGVPEILADLQPVLFVHMPSLAVIDRAVFVPCLFTGWKTLAVAPGNREISETGGLVPITPEELIEVVHPEQAPTRHSEPDLLMEPPYWRNWPATFDYVLWIDFSGTPKSELKELKLLTTGSFFSIYRVVRP
jgi:hypothetical protein